MDEPFDLPVVYKGQELIFTAQLLQLGYTHSFAVDVYGQEFLFEPDEERTYRAMIDVAQMQQNKKVDIELLKAIAASIQAIVE